MDESKIKLLRMLESSEYLLDFLDEAFNKNLEDNEKVKVSINVNITEYKPTIKHSVGMDGLVTETSEQSYSTILELPSTKQEVTELLIKLINSEKDRNKKLSTKLNDILNKQSSRDATQLDLFDICNKDVGRAKECE